MNPFFTNTGKVKAIKQFVGGNEKQRTHLNEVVDAVNTVTKEAQKTKAADAVLANLENMKPVLVYLVANGAPALVKIPMEIQA